MQVEERHLLLRIQNTGAPGDGACLLEVEAQVDHGAIYSAGRVELEPAQLARLQKREGNEYGRYLGQRLSSCLPVKSAIASFLPTDRVRIQFMLEPPGSVLGTIRWERVELSSMNETAPLARSYTTPLSRFASVNRPETQPVAGQMFHVLLIVASPDGLDRIDGDAEIGNLLDACGELLEHGWMQVTVLAGLRGLSDGTREAARAKGVRLLEGAATVERVAKALHGNPVVHGVHVLAHGSFYDDTFHLFLENEAGELDPVASCDLLQRWPMRQVRLVLLQSCQSAMEGSTGPQAQGFMQDLLEAGVPGVIGMQENIRMDDARAFCGAFYASLVRDGCADRAVNLGRAAMEDRGDGAWAIPIFSTRLVRASVWVESPLARAQELLEGRIRANWAARQFRELPLDVLMVDRSTLEGQTRQGADEFLTMETQQSAYRLDVFEALRRHLTDEGAAKTFTCIVGERGRAKKQLLEWLFLASRDLARSPEAGTGDRICVMLPLAECSRVEYDAETTIARAIAVFYEGRTGLKLGTQAIADRFARDRFLFLVHGDDNVGRPISDGLAVLNDFSRAAGNERHRFVLTLDTNLLRISEIPADTQCLLVQPMKPERVRKYLATSPAGSAERRLLAKLETSAMFDLTEVPWLLNEMLGQERRNVLGRSRTAIISRVVADGISRFTGTRASAVRLRDALQRFAWVVQNRRDYFLKGPEAYEILQQLRGNRDYPLFGLLTDMVNSCNILASIGEDGVGFNYPGFRTYCAAEYLASQPDDLRDTMLQDITAQLGRQSRAVIWRETLVFLAGLWSETARLLAMVLSGSLLHQGEQVFIAARCLAEARLSFADAPTCDEPIVQSIVGALLQIVSPGARSLEQKLRAIEHLGPLKERQALVPLLSLLLEATRLDPENRACLEFSCVRLAAIKSIACALGEVRALVEQDERWHRIPRIGELFEAWSVYDEERLNALLATGEEPVASAAAMVLALSRSEAAAEMLGDRFLDPHTTEDTLWAVTDALLDVGDAGLPKLVRDTLDRADRAHMLAHMIGKIGKFPGNSAEVAFLKAQLAGEDEALAGRCLQALAELGDASMLPLCHRWLLERPLSSCFFVLQALRNIGNWQTLCLLEQKSWTADDTAPAYAMDALRVEVYESVYWQLVGGMSRETMAPVSPQPSASAQPTA